MILTKSKMAVNVKTKSLLKTHRKAKDKSFSNFKYHFSHPVMFFIPFMLKKKIDINAKRSYLNTSDARHPK